MADSTDTLAPHATRLKLLENGWTPIPLFGKGQRIDLQGRVWPEVPKGWPDVKITPEWLKKAKRKWKNTAIRTGRILAVDIDVTDPELAAAAESYVRGHLGQTPFKRTGKAPKTLLLYWLTSTQRKRRTQKYEGHQVEFLSAGSYFVAYGEHPGTGKPYVWEGMGNSEPLTRDVDDLPEVTSEDVSRCLEGLEALFEGAGLVPDQGAERGAEGEAFDLTDDMAFTVVDPLDDLVTWGELKNLVPKDETWFCHLTGFRPESDSGGGLISWGGEGLHLHDLVTGITHYQGDGFKELGDKFLKKYGDPFKQPDLGDLSYHERELAAVRILPKLGKGILLNVKRNADGGYAARQPTTGTNVGAVLDAIGVDVRLDLMTHRVAPRFTRDDLDRLTPDGEQGGHFVRSQTWAMCLEVGMGESAAYEQELMVRAMRFHPFEEWLKTGPSWDKVERLNDMCGTVDIVDEYADIWPVYLKRWLIQCVEAACGWHRERIEQKAGVLVLSGPQNIGKTTWLSSLVPPEYFKEGVGLNFASAEKDSVMRATGALIVELGELETTFKKSDAGALKAFLSNETDRWRPPYAKDVIEWPRCTSYAGTVNSSGFLVDETGSRRFWPVEVNRCNARHDMDMRQVWAEVYSLWLAGEDWRLNTDEEGMRIGQAERFEQTTDVLEVVAAWLDSRPDLPKADWCPVSTKDMASMLGLNLADTRKAGQLRAKMEGIYGRQRTIQGKRRAWLVPVTKGELNAAGIQSVQNLSEIV